MMLTTMTAETGEDGAGRLIGAGAAAWERQPVEHVGLVVRDEKAPLAIGEGARRGSSSLQRTAP